MALYEDDDQLDTGDGSTTLAQQGGITWEDFERQQAQAAQRAPQQDIWTDYQPPQQDTWTDYQPPQQQQDSISWEDFEKQQAPQQDSISWEDFEKQQAPPLEAESPLGHVARKVAHNILPTAAAIGTTALTMPLSPFVAIPTGIGTFWAAKELQEAGLKAAGYGDAEQMALNAKVNPKADIAGDVISAAIPFGVGPKLALGQRALGAAIGTGVEAVGQVLQGETDPTRLAVAAGTGALFNQPRALTQRFEGAVQSAAGRITGRDWWAPAPAREAPPGRHDLQGAPQPGSHEAAVTVEQGTPGSTAAAGVSEIGVKPDQVNVSNREIGVGSERQYGKETSPAVGPSTTVSEASPEVKAALDALNQKAAPTADLAAMRQRIEAIQQRALPADVVPVTANPDLTPQERLAMAIRRGGGSESVAAAMARRDDRLIGPLPTGATPTGSAAVPPRGPVPATGMPGGGAAVPPHGPAPAAGMPGGGPPGGGAVPPGGGAVPPGGGAVPPGGAFPGGAPPPGGNAPAPALQPASAQDLQTGLIAGLRRLLVPRWSSSADIAASAIREATGPMHRVREQALARFSNDMYRQMNAMGAGDFRNFMRAYESGQTAALPAEQQRLVQPFRQAFDDFRRELQSLPQAQQMNVIADYFPHMWENPQQAQKFLGEWYAAGGGSLRKRTHPTFEDGIVAGLVPKSANPMEYLVRYGTSISNFVAQRRMLNTLENDGYIGWFAPKTVGASGAPQPLVRNAPPEGYAKIEVPWASKNGKDAYAPRDIADTVNNFYHAGLRRNESAAGIVDFLQQTKNMWTGLELGVSAYHAFTEIHESVASGLARALQRMAAGDIAGGLGQLVTAPGEFVSAAVKGHRMMQLYRGQTVGNAMERRLMDAMAKANIRPGDLASTGEYNMSRLGDYITSGLRGSLWNELKSDWAAMRGGDVGKMAAFVPQQVGRLMQTIAYPLFQGYIPRLKLGALAKDMEAYLAANPRASDAQLAAAARKLADSVDSRMGEMVSDNLFMNTTLKQMGFIGLRSFAWTVGGPFREILGGAASGMRGMLQGQNRLDPRSPNFDPRVAYAVAFPASVAGISALWQYLRTGEGPQDWRDLVVPKTGGTVLAAGQKVPERQLLPGYHKDFLGYWFHPGRELWAKVAAPWQTLYEQIANRKWNERAITPPGATLKEQLEYRGAHLGEKLVPLGIKTAMESPRKGSAIGPVERGLGFRVPGSYITNPRGYHQQELERQQRDWHQQELLERRDRVLRGLPGGPFRHPPPGVTITGYPPR